MRLVTWYDDDGFFRQVYARDEDSDEVARESGLGHEPPDLRQIDWDEVAKEMYNLLAQRGLITWQDIQKQDTALLSIVKSVAMMKIIALYRKK